LINAVVVASDSVGLTHCRVHLVSAALVLIMVLAGLAGWRAYRSTWFALPTHEPQLPAL
jgi:hypothetical protein